MIDLIGIATSAKIIDKLIDTIFDYSVQKLLDKGISKAFPKDSYKKELIGIIHKTIEEFEKKYSVNKEGNKFPFYHSQILFEHYSMYVLFDEKKHSNETLKNELKSNSNIIEPTNEQLEYFYELFKINANSNEYLKQLFIESNYKARIFDISTNLKGIDEKIGNIQETLSSLTKTEVLKTVKARFNQKNSSKLCFGVGRG